MATFLQKVTQTYCPPLNHYDGKDLEAAFASEIAGYGDVWAWLKARLASKDITGIFVKDYVTITTANGYTVQCQIADINHDLHFMDTEITEYHIDFVSKDLWNIPHGWNKANYNNGLSAEGDPWLCSDLKAWLNSEKANVPNGATADPATIAVDYSTTGVYDKLPQSLKNVIIERRSFEPIRYTAGSLLVDDNSIAWKNIGKLWVPNETEVYGFIAWGTRSGYSIGETHQFPIFTDGKTRVKGLGNGDERYKRYKWWLRSARSGNSIMVADVDISGVTGIYNTAITSLGAPVCFRISA